MMAIAPSFPSITSVYPLVHMLWTVVNMSQDDQIHVTGGFRQCLHYFMYIMSRTEVQIPPYKDGAMLCVSKCERTRDKDICCVFSLLSKTLIQPLTFFLSFLHFQRDNCRILQGLSTIAVQIKLLVVLQLRVI